MNARVATFAIAALSLCSIPSDGLAQGNSGKTRITICHIPPGNPDAHRTLNLPEPAWRAHEAHGDTIGPCEGYDDEYGAQTQRSKKVGKKKDRDAQHGGSVGEDGEDVEDVEEESAADDRAGKRRHIDERDSVPDAEEIDEAADSDGQNERRAARREARTRDRSGADADESQAEGNEAPTDTGALEEGDAGTGSGEVQKSDESSERELRARRRDRTPQPDPVADDSPEEKRGFFRGVQQFFGFGEDESAE